MNNTVKVAGIVAIAAMVMFGMYTSDKSYTKQLESDNYKKCVEVMVKALPDPNDDSRASFLQNCQSEK